MTSPEPVQPSAADGARIGPYRLIRELGRGGMGTVYLAVRTDDAYQKRVAIKVLKRGMDTDAIVRRFRNERQIASYDKTVAIYDAIVARTSPDAPLRREMATRLARCWTAAAAPLRR